MYWIFWRLKNWVLFTLQRVAGLVFLYCKSCASRLEKGFSLNSLNCIKFFFLLPKHLNNLYEQWGDHIRSKSFPKQWIQCGADESSSENSCEIEYAWKMWKCNFTKVLSSLRNSNFFMRHSIASRYVRIGILAWLDSIWDWICSILFGIVKKLKKLKTVR